MGMTLTIRGHTFLPGAIRRDGIIVDLGANRGHFARAMLHHFDHVRYIAVEANPDLAVTLVDVDKRMTVIHAAVIGQEMPVTFNISDNCEQSSISATVAGISTRHVTVPGRILAHILEEQGIDRVDLLKVDIEGAEAAVFETVPDAVLERISQISIEFHDFLNAYSPQTVLQIASRLERSGFYPIKFSRSNMNWLFIHPVRCRVNLLSRLYIKYVLRYLRRARVALGIERYPSD